MNSNNSVVHDITLKDGINPEGFQPWAMCKKDTSERQQENSRITGSKMKMFIALKIFVVINLSISSMTLDSCILLNTVHII